MIYVIPRLEYIPQPWNAQQFKSTPGHLNNIEPHSAQVLELDLRIRGLVLAGGFKFKFNIENFKC